VFISLIQTATTNPSSNFWDPILTIMAALIGGGLVTLIFDLIRSSRKTKKVRRLIKYEIQMNLDVLDSETAKNHPWMSHKTWTSFYEANSIEITTFTSDEIAKKILLFYSHLETLRMHDSEDQEVERLQKEEKFDAADMYRNTLSNTKKGVRDILINLAHEILNKD